MDFIIHYSNMLLELYLWVNTIKRENADILQLGVNENAILASICITVRSLEIDWGIMSLSWPQLWFLWPMLWNSVISILGRLQNPDEILSCWNFHWLKDTEPSNCCFQIFTNGARITVGFICIYSSNQSQIWPLVLKDTEFSVGRPKNTERIQTFQGNWL